ncbi:mucin 2, oligomeric mucus/gel-forming [Rhinolophus ferrumequinum]|uniref:Mucin 2, oligomeric mucus/gel-forming n=1 Tax=Rhinolophus ferrumequinum TaxID=59479 RepID=A0A7J7W8C0_RHIFE|nr:mucin 2, oligomeric mucus/gel-forming [Rhinolophus ferrumequinum]
MGLPLACLVALCLALTPARSVELRREGRTRNHGHNVCSTWGDFHYKTFDGDVYRFPGLCDYNLASDCRSSYKEFAVHVKRSPGRGGGHPQFQHILLMIKDDTIYLTHQLVVVNGAIVTTPHYSSGLLIEKNDAYTKVFSRAGLSLIWNREDSLMLELDSKFRNHTCGLCGDYNGLQNYSEFLSDGVLFSAIEFGNMQKIIKPEEVCDDPEDVPAPKSCSEHRAECEELLTAMAFEECLGLVPLEPYVQTCMQDRCQCPPGASCMCSTIAEFSRQCSHAGGRPGNWRTATLCPKSCPGNMVYMESGSPCMDTCSHLEISSLCEEHRMDGCFCPEGTVYDDMAGKGCIPVSQCHCKLHGHLYAPGQKVTNNCEHCVCNAGRWVCKDLPCPGTCALEGGSHITTFDGKKYTFHGDCYYVLTKDEHNDSYALLGELAPCGSTDKQTCLKTVVLLADKKKNVVAFKSDGSVLLNELQVNLPHVTASFSIFQPSSYHLVVSTTFGLRLQVQLVPVMQLFLTLDQASQGRVQGLCGNFNGQESDDFKTAGGLVEATGAGFANTWKAQSNCHDKLDWLDDPCSLNIESANYAEHWCSLLKKTESPFGRCHSAVDPAEYYKRCRYDTCNCQNNEDCMCAALSSYARACATKGVMLWGWRELVCNKDVGSCPKSQVFLYNLTTCQQTCRSLSEPDSHCLKGFAPVDGCGCPDHTFLDEKGRCVPLAKCSCYHRGLYLEAGEVVLKQEERCVCRNGRLHCTQVKLLGQSCAAPKIHVDCNNLTALSIRNPRPVSCQTLAAGYYHTECISGCVCPEGQMDDGRGGCVVEKECPCMHNKHLYNPGDKIKVDCNTCTCQKGRWACTQTGCHGTCTIYGSGHYITFDGKQYDFDGHCSYVATQDYCGQNSSLGSFSIITENVPCGTTGVTCSKAIKIFIGRTELKLEDKHRMVIQRDVGHRVGYTTRDVGQYLVVETSTGIIVIWDKRTTIFIKLAPSYKGSVCGLCGNFDQRSNNDFTTRDNMVVESELDFGNSWKEAPTCPDVTTTPEPCVKNPHRQAWAEKQCSIIKSPVFSICHSKVDPKPFYEACVHDSCSCDTGGDCECFCSAVAAYAQECTKEEACVYWRTPDLCPVFCDYYNPPDECEWHYEPCGNRSFETCRTINGIHSNISVSYLEGCYPRCPADRPIYNEDLKKCVTSNECGCYHEGILYPPGASVPPRNECESCVCINSSLTLCQPEEGKILNYTQDGSFCYWEICGPNATVEKHFNICMSTLPPFSSPTPTTTTTTCTTTPTTTTPTPSTVSSVPSTTPGDVVYNGTHGETCYYVNCSLSCQLEFFNWSCPSTPSPTPTPSKPTPSSTPSPSTPTTRPSTASSTPTSTKPPGCPNFDPPRQENETWWLCNCTMAVCKHNNTVELVEVECNPPPMPTCSNNLTPVRVMDPDGCCWHWECDCYCTGWGDPHYVTFDGLYYSYQGNCTYVLVEQIDPKVDNFGVYIDNYHCDINDQVSCPRTLIVRHETQEVLVKTVHMAPMKVQVQVNKQAVALPYKKYGLQVYESGINYVVDIPELGAVISYNGLSFSIRLPYRLFGNNTKGQCGTCTNSTEDDCVLPSGEVVSNCEVAADEWVVNDPSKPHCPHTTFTTRRPATTPSGGSGHTPNKDCASPLCELIKDSLFAQCHSLAPPEHYYEACRFDSCFVPNSGMECVSLQTYAALCAQEGVCVDWRNHTHGVCSMSCPSHKEYQACGPAEEPTCKSSSSQNNTVLVEGCFCPEGTMSYAPGFDVCVKSCGCVGPDNVPREFGEHFEFDCKDCVCLEGGSGIVCEPKKCTQNSPKCTEDGTYPVTEVDPANTCCNITTCKCNTSLCKEKAPLCALGFDVKSEMVPGRCCPVYSCVPKGVCVLENAEYQPGSPVYSSKCQHCVCTNTTDSATQLNLVSCSHVPCNTTCDIGFELVDAPGECCRKCEQTHCIINRPDNQHFILKPGDMKSDPKNNCTFFSCVKIHNQLISSVSNITCPDFDPTTCLPGSITLMPNGCCKKCIPRNETRIPCSTIPMTKIVTDAGCTGKITTNYCSGSCGTFAMYSAEAQALDHKCSCCKEQRTSRRQVVLSCPDGSSRSHTYTHIESCLCQDTVCEIPLAQRRVPSRGRRSSSQVLRPGTA